MPGPGTGPRLGGSETLCYTMSLSLPTAADGKAWSLVRPRYRSFNDDYCVGSTIVNSVILKVFEKYSRTQLIWINWYGQPSGYVENSDNWIFLW